MAALSAEYMEILRRELQSQYVAHLPPLLPAHGGVQPPDKQISRALSAFALGGQLALSAPDAAKAVIDDFGDQGIDAIYYDAKTETLHLVQSKLKAEDFSLPEAQAFVAGTRLLFKQDFAAFNKNVTDRQAEIEAALGEASHIELWVVCTGGAITGPAKDTFTQFFADPSHGEAERLIPHIRHIHPDLIAQDLRQRNSYQAVNADVYLTHDVCIKEPRLTWYGMARVEDLVALHAKEGKALYEKNVRYYLGGRSDVNKGIQQTLKDDPGSFFYLNNGITALCSSIDVKDRKANRRKLKVRGMSIINGAQTVASAAELMGQGTPPDISQAHVMLTLIQANADGAFGPKVTKARNSQNTVLLSDFAAQDPVQARLAQELAGLSINYHVRSDVGAKSGPNDILLTEAVAAMAWLAIDPRYPVWLKSGRGELSNTQSPQYQALFGDELMGAHLANAVVFYRVIHDLLVAADKSALGQERLVYRHGMHAIGGSYFKRLRRVIQQPKLIDKDAAGQLVSQSFDQHRQVALDKFATLFVGPLAFFKNQAQTVSYLRDVMIHAYGLADHAAIPALNQATPHEKFPLERLFSFLSQQAPQLALPT